MALEVDKFQNVIDLVAKDVIDVRNTLAFLGAVLAAYYGGKLAISSWRGVWTHLISRLWPRNFPVEYGGTWAVVTGPTRGIGRSYAEALAKRGMNIALVGRDAARLAIVQDAVLKYNVKCEYFDVDFGNDDAKTIESKLEKLLELDIGVLVNNVGWRNTQGPLFLSEMEKSSLHSCVIVNCFSTAIMMRLILPGMMARKKGAVINISSLAAIFPLQLNSLYSASKAFVDFLSRATNLEAGHSGVTVQTVTPGFVYTGEHYHYKKPTLMTPDPDRFVDFALTTLGFSSRTAGYPLHDLEMFFLNLFGETFHRFVSGKMMWGRRNKLLKEKSN